MELKTKTKKAGAFVATVSIIIIIVVGIYASGMLKPITAQAYFPNRHLFVDATYLLKTDETNDSVNVTCTPYITNIWSKESGEIKIIAYVIETKNNLAVYKQEVEVGKIGANNTAEIEIPIILSNNSYKVDVLIFENEKLVMKGTITISACPVYIWDDISHSGYQIWNLKNSIGEFVQIH